MSNITPVEKLKTAMKVETVQEQFQNAMGENKNLFVSSLIDVFASDTYLQKCNPNLVILEALKAATLKLPINKSLGFAYIVPYKGVPQFQIGYKGYIQLAMRTGLYRTINAGKVYEGELKSRNKLSGSIDLSGERTGDKVVGYFAHIELLNGFTKTVYSTVDQAEKHGKKYSKSYNKASSPWQKQFDAMAIKTMIRALLSKYGAMSVEMITALSSDNDDRPAADRLEDDMSQGANGEVIDIKPEPPTDDDTPDY